MVGEDFMIRDGVLVCYNRKCDVVIPDGVKVIASGAFESDHSLLSVVIPDGVEKIEERAFEDCYQLASVTLPVSVKEIGKTAFSYCSRELTIFAPAGSYAETFAKEHNYRLGEVGRLLP